MCEMPALAARFEIERVKAADYGLACWEIFWRAVDPSEVTGIKFFEGDSRQTLQGAESVFCIAAWAPRDEPLARLKTSLEENEVFRRCASEPPFAQLADEELLLGDSGLVDAGQITSAGELVGDAGTGRRALGVVRRQKRHDRDEGPDNTAASRPFPASARTADLHEPDSFSEPLELLDLQFKPTGYR